MVRENGLGVKNVQGGDDRALRRRTAWSRLNGAAMLGFGLVWWGWGVRRW